MLKWYVIYCVAMAILYLLCSLGGVILLVNVDNIASMDPTTESMEIWLMGLLLIVLCVPLMFLYGAAPLLPKNRLGWNVGLVCIALGMTSTCCIPFAIFLLIGWINEATRSYFGVSSK